MSENEKHSEDYYEAKMQLLTALLGILVPCRGENVCDGCSKAAELGSKRYCPINIVNEALRVECIELPPLEIRKDGK